MLVLAFRLLIKGILITLNKDPSLIFNVRMDFSPALPCSWSFTSNIRPLWRPSAKVLIPGIIFYEIITSSFRSKRGQNVIFLYNVHYIKLPNIALPH